MQKQIFKTQNTLRCNQFYFAKLSIFRLSTLGFFDTTLLCFNWRRHCSNGIGTPFIKFAPSGSNLKLRHCIHANVEKLGELFTSCNASLDVIALSETKLKQQHTCKMTPEGYNLRILNKFSGIGMFIKDTISFYAMRELSRNLADCKDIWVQLEHKFIKVQLTQSTDTLTNSSQHFIKKFECAIDNISKKKELCYLYHGGFQHQFLVKQYFCQNFLIWYTAKVVFLQWHNLHVLLILVLPYKLYLHQQLREKNKSFILLHDLSDHLLILVGTNLNLYDRDLAEILIWVTKHFEGERFMEDLHQNLNALNLPENNSEDIN